MAGASRDDKPLSLSPALLEQLGGWAREGYPEESCGVLVGRHLPDAIVVHRAIRVANVSPERRHDRYVLDPDALLRVDVEARAEDLEIVGFWHTHPDHPARPSRTDLEAAWEGYAYVIVSVTRAGVDAITAWRLAEGEFYEQAIAALEEAQR